MIKSKADLKEYLRLDAISSGIKTTKSLQDILFPNPIYVFQKNLRYLEYYTNCRSFLGKFYYLYYKIRHRQLSLKLGFSIPVNVFEAGLSIAHYGTIIVNPNAKIGKNCRLHACVNIGASAGSQKAPVIGNNVYIGPGALIFGDITIGDNTTIAANATVNKSSLNPNVILAGTPAKVIRDNYPDWTIFNNRNQN